MPLLLQTVTPEVTSLTWMPSVRYW